MTEARRILVARHPGETWFALLTGPEVTDISIVRDSDVQPGAIFAGRVDAHIKGQGVCLVDLGQGEPGFLQSAKKLPDVGSYVRVEVTAAAGRGKGPVVRRRDHAEALKGPPRQLSAATDPATLWRSQSADGNVEVIAADVMTGTRLRRLGIEAATIHRDSDDLFDHFGVNDAIEQALGRTVQLVCGGTVVFDATAAAWTIDINAGSASPDEANEEALGAIARQLRLRNISGHVLIDLIPMRRRTQSCRKLATLVGEDPIKTQIAGLTPLGMIELTRQRIRPALSELLSESMTGKPFAVAYRALRLAARATRGRPAAEVVLRVAPSIASILTGPLLEAKKEAEAMIGSRLSIAPCETHAVSRVDVEAAP